MNISKKSINLLIEFEITSKELYNKKYQGAIWPGGSSGVTIGIGYDLGMQSKEKIKKNWEKYVPQTTLNLLMQCANITGEKAKKLLPKLNSVKISYDIAEKVFYSDTLKEYALKTKKTYPGVEKLNPDTVGALISLIYNRGTNLDSSDRRKEMVEIKNLVASQDYKNIAIQLRSMKRLWDNGLVNRYEKTSQLVEKSDRTYKDDELIYLDLS